MGKYKDAGAPGAQQRKTERVLLISRQERADVFINPIGGTELYCKEEFARQGLKLCFIKTGEYHYPQFSAAFHPGLSILDVLLNCGIEGTKELLNNFELV